MSNGEPNLTRLTGLGGTVRDIDYGPEISVARVKHTTGYEYPILILIEGKVVASLSDEQAEVLVEALNRELEPVYVPNFVNETGAVSYER